METDLDPHPLSERVEAGGIVNGTMEKWILPQAVLSPVLRAESDHI